MYMAYLYAKIYICSFTDRKQKIKIYREEKDERNRLCKRKELYIKWIIKDLVPGGFGSPEPGYPGGRILWSSGTKRSGKTTAINCILALLKYDKGSIRIFGKEMEPDNYEAKRQIGIVQQNVAVFDEFTVYENIDYSAACI